MEVCFENYSGFIVADEIDVSPIEDVMYVHFYNNGHLISSLPALMIRSISRFNELIFISNVGCEHIERKVNHE